MKAVLASGLDPMLQEMLWVSPVNKIRIQIIDLTQVLCQQYIS